MAQAVGVAGLAAARAPAGDRIIAAEVGPFAEVGLAQHHRAGLAQASHQIGIAWLEALQRQRAGRGGHGGGVDVVLQQHRDAVQRATQAACTALAVTFGRFLQGIGVEFQHRAQAGSGAVQGGDALEVGGGEGGAVQLTADHPRLQIGHVGFGVGEGHVAAAGRGGVRGRCRRTAAHGKQGGQGRGQAGQQGRQERAHRTAGSAPIVSVAAAQWRRLRRSRAST